MAKKGIMDWAKDLKHNEKVAEKFTGVKTITDILSVARANGYEFTERELMDLDLDSVAGGTDANANSNEAIKDLKKSIKINIDTTVIENSSTAVGEGATSQNNSSISTNIYH